jgi:4-hydroxyacetophenone monooxygenase
MRVPIGEEPRTSDRMTGMDAINGADLARAIAAADLRVLLMALFHATGDRTWLSAPFLPQRDVRLVADPLAGFSDDVADQIRSAALAQFATSQHSAITDPGDDLMFEMMTVCLGEQIDARYAPLMREDLGFVSKDDGIQFSADQPHQTVVIVGAGISGLALGSQLLRLGVPFTILERNLDVGGTWFDNRYPGCGVDTPNHAYSFSNGSRARWTKYFSKRDEIQEYIAERATEFGVREHIRFGHTVTAVEWSDVSQSWTITATHDDQVVSHRADVFVSAVGVLNIPKQAPITDMESFQGRIVHTARWPDDLDLTDKRVAVVGTGASAMQLVPAIASRTATLTIYQRSAQWARDAQWLFDHVPYYLEWFRFTMWWRYGDGLLRHLRRDPDWPHPDRAVNRVNDRHRAEMASYIESELEGRTDLLAKCMPTYPPYGKRILIDNGWFATLRQPHVELVTEPIDRAVTDGFATSDGVIRNHDVIVFATGFETRQLTARLNVRGRNGRRLEEAWKAERPTAHLGMMVPEFPNMFLMLGPNTGLGHGGSTFFMSECQARYITACVAAMQRGDRGPIEVRRSVHDEYVDRVDRAHEELIWTHPGMSNWYRNPDGIITALLPWRLVDYWQMTHDPDWEDMLS